MGKSARNKELPAILRGQNNTFPLAPSWTSLSQVNSNVKDSARDYAHKLCLWMLNLEVKAAEHALNGIGLVVLYKRSINAAGNKVFFTISLHKATTRITVQLYVHNLYTFNRGVIKRKIARLNRVFKLFWKLHSVHLSISLGNLLYTSQV